ncbi:MAG: response regulator transcription factor, partial [Solirubrobacteraceae bacterium]
PDVAELQVERTAEVRRLARARRDFETLGAAANFRAMVSYLCGRPDDLADAVAESQRAAETTGQPYYRHVYGCLAQANAFMRGAFAEAERWAGGNLGQTDTVGDEMTEGPHSVQIFMIRRETAGIERIRPLLDGREDFAARWVPGLLALYTELGIPAGVRRGLSHLMDRGLAPRGDEAQWPMVLVFMVEGALFLEDRDSLRRLQPLLAEYAEKNLVCGTLIATFGSAERFLGRAAALLGDTVAAEQHFIAAHAMDTRMRSVVHVAETLAHHALFAAGTGQTARAHGLARQARSLAEPIGQGRVLHLLQRMTQPALPDGLSDREADVLRLLSTGLSNHEIGLRLHISPNTTANHIRSILMKSGCANRTQAAMYASRHLIV